MRILFLSRWYPVPANNGSKLRILALLKGLSQEHEVSLISFFAPAEGQPDTHTLDAVCRKVFPIARRDFNPSSKKARLGFFSLTPRSVIDTYAAEVEHRIRTELATEHYDLIIASQFDMAIYARAFGGLPAIFEEAEVGVFYDRFHNSPNLTSRLRHGLTWWKHKRYLVNLLKHFVACTVVSDQEAQILRQFTPQVTSLVVIPNCVELSDYNMPSCEPEPDTLIFTGSFTYEPNYEAMYWFIGEVLPILQKITPNIELTVTGDHAERQLPSMQGVHLTGYVPNIRELIARSWISIAPLHSGGGTRLKILEAMALNTPVVATSKGAEGLELTPGKHLLVADHPEEFAKACLQILSNPGLRVRLAKNAYQAIQERYDWQAVMPKYLNLLSDVIRN